MVLFLNIINHWEWSHSFNKIYSLKKWIPLRNRNRILIWEVTEDRTWNNKVLPVFAAYALISIQVQNPFIQLGKTDVDIRCLVNDNENERIRAIQLIRSNANIVSVTENGVFWQDQELQHRAVAKGSVMNATSSYLHMAIVRQNVTKNDSGTYFCKSSAKDRNPQESQKTFLNITGNYIFI